MNDKFIVEVRIVGQDIAPEKISSRDVGELIASIEQMIASVVARDNPSLQIDEKEVIVGLAAVQQGSYILQFQSVYADEVAQAYTFITQSIASADYSDLPPKTLNAIKDIRKITRKYRTDTEFWSKNGVQQQLAVVTQNTRIELDTPLISGKTTVYGTVIGIGGEDPPRVRIRLIDGRQLYCNITRRDDLRVARQLGQRLYQRVGLHGTARWDVRDMALVDFVVETVTEFVQKPISEAISNLYNVAGEYYEAIDDIEELIRDVRGNDEDF
jgi:hypothetical protein